MHDGVTTSVTLVHVQQSRGAAANEPVEFVRASDCHAHTASPRSRFCCLSMCPRIAQDTAGQERFNSMHPSYYYRAHACILVFDVTRKVTYQHLQEWYDELMQYRPGLPTLVVANKIDGQVERQMAGEEALASERQVCIRMDNRGDGALVACGRRVRCS